MPKKAIARADSFAEDDEDEVETVRPPRPAMPMNEADRVMTDGTLPSERYISPKILLEQEKARAHALEEALVQARAAGQALAADGSIIVHDFQLTPSGLIAPEQVSYEAWEQVGHLLFRLEGSIQWLIGDWLLYGEQVQWGETSDIAKSLGREAQTLYHYKSICQVFEFCRRRQNLSFGHHDAVRGLPTSEQDHALDHAEAHHLSVAAFRKWLRGEQPSPALPASSALTFRSLSGDLDKFMQIDPAKAKPQEREQAETAYHHMAQSLQEYRQKWGIEE